MVPRTCPGPCSEEQRWDEPPPIPSSAKGGPTEGDKIGLTMPADLEGNKCQSETCRGQQNKTLLRPGHRPAGQTVQASPRLLTPTWELTTCRPGALESLWLGVQRNDLHCPHPSLLEAAELTPFWSNSKPQRPTRCPVQTAGVEEAMAREQGLPAWKETQGRMVPAKPTRVGAPSAATKEEGSQATHPRLDTTDCGAPAASGRPLRARTTPWTPVPDGKHTSLRLPGINQDLPLQLYLLERE